MQISEASTVGEIVANDFRLAAVFQGFGIDFCCGGKRTLADACRQRNVDAAVVLEAIERTSQYLSASLPFDAWEPEMLISFIVEKHHDYVRRTLPSLTGFTQKLASVHGDRHPELREVASLTADVSAEMTAHMEKEERILFPYIGAMAAAVKQGCAAPGAPFGAIENPIRMMELEHESAGTAMARISQLTGGYSVPDDGCTTYRVCLQALQAFEQDLHQHVHLENNILFPKALALAGRTSG